MDNEHWQRSFLMWWFDPGCMPVAHQVTLSLFSSARQWRKQGRKTPKVMGQDTGG